jgi:hypothetical protein
MDPATGTFLSRDAMEAEGQHGFGYAAGNPITATDPRGTRIWGTDGCEGNPAAGCGGYTFGLGVCRGGEWNGSPDAIAARLNAKVAHAGGDKFVNFAGKVGFCYDVGKKNSNRLLAIGNGEYANACKTGLTLGSLDPNISCEGSFHSDFNGSGVYGGECRNQFGGVVGGFATSGAGVSTKACAAGVATATMAAVFALSIAARISPEAALAAVLTPEGAAITGIGIAVSCPIGQIWAADS